jgi:hypothetical protein
MPIIAEVLAVARHGQAIVCPYTQAVKHPDSCVCRGSGKVKICPDCEGAGWKGILNTACRGCGGTGCHRA